MAVLNWAVVVLLAVVTVLVRLTAVDGAPLIVAVPAVVLVAVVVAVVLAVFPPEELVRDGDEADEAALRPPADTASLWASTPTKSST